MGAINHEWTTFPTCPHCGEADQDWWDSLEPKNDGDEWPVDCSWCDKEYILQMNVSADFSTWKSDAKNLKENKK